MSQKSFIGKMFGKSQEGEDHGLESLDYDARDMIKGIVELSQTTVKEVMVPRIDVVFLSKDIALAEMFEMIISCGHSRFPVYEDTIDNLVGYVHAYDMFSKPPDIEKVTRKADVFPETMAAKNLLDFFIKKHKSTAIVVDEFGGTSGIVTMEDIIEEIFGEIEDEHDKEQMVEKEISPNEYIFSTRIEIDYLNEKYKFNMTISDEYETLAGFIIHFHESIPAVDETIEIPPFKFTILKSSGNRIEEVKLEV